MNYNFEIGKSFAGIELDISVPNAIKRLGNPIRTYKDRLGMSLLYDNIGLILSYEKKNQNFTDLGIQTDKLIYDGKNWYDYNKNDLIKIIKKIYQKKKYNFEFDKTKIECTEEEQFDFYEIGVALFFNKNKLTNVIVSKPII